MNISEQNLYLKTTKTMVNCFEKFVDNIEKFDDVLSDAELLNSMKRINKRLEIVVNKWDNKLPKLDMINGIGTDILQALSNDPNYDDFKSLVEGGRMNFPSSFKDCATDEAKPGCSNVKNDASTMLKFKDVDEKLILGAEGFLIEETSPGFWKCNPCVAVNIPIHNMISHINGKNHKKRIGIKN